MGESNPKLPEAVKDAVVLSAGDRYKELVRRVKAGHGKFDAESARHLMDRPVAMKSNLHSVLFETTTGKLWVANASKDGQARRRTAVPRVRLPALLEHQADPSAPTLPCPPAAATKAARAAAALAVPSRGSPKTGPIASEDDPRFRPRKIQGVST